MQLTPYYHWLLPRQRDGKLIRASWTMTEEQAKAYPGAVKCDRPPEMRMVCAPGEEPPVSQSTGGYVTPR